MAHRQRGECFTTVGPCQVDGCYLRSEGALVRWLRRASPVGAGDEVRRDGQGGFERVVQGEGLKRRGSQQGDVRELAENHPAAVGHASAGSMLAMGMIDLVNVGGVRALMSCTPMRERRRATARCADGRNTMAHNGLWCFDATRTEDEAEPTSLVSSHRRGSV